MVNQYEVIVSLDVKFNDTKLPAVTGEVNGNDDSDPSSGNGSVSTQLSILNRTTLKG